MDCSELITPDPIAPAAWSPAPPATITSCWKLNLFFISLDKYAVGSFTLGYQYSEEDNGRATTKTGYENTGYGIVFAVNDDLSISYNNYESEQKGTTSTTAEASSVQLAYSSGGLSVRFAEQTVDNKNYATAAANQRDARTITVALAF